MMTFFLFISALLAIAAVTVHAVRQDRNNQKQLRSFPPFLQTFAVISNLQKQARRIFNTFFNFDQKAH